MIPSAHRSLEDLEEADTRYCSKTELALLRLHEGEQPATANNIAQRVTRHGGTSADAIATGLRHHPDVEHEHCPERGVHVYWTREVKES